MRDQQVEIVRRYIDGIWNKKDPAVVDECCTDDYIVEPLWSNFMIPAEALQVHGDGGEAINKEVAKRIVTMWVTALPDLVMTFDDFIVEDDKVMSLHTAVAHELGPLFGMEPHKLAEEARVRAILINHFRPGEDRIWKTNTFWDFWHMLLSTGTLHRAYRFLGPSIPGYEAPPVVAPSS